MERLRRPIQRLEELHKLPWHQLHWDLSFSVINFQKQIDHKQKPFHSGKVQHIAHRKGQCFAFEQTGTCSNANFATHVSAATKSTLATNVLNKGVKQTALPTPIRPDKLKSWLKLSRYDVVKSRELVGGFSHGFSVIFEDQINIRENQYSFNENIDVS